MRRGKLQNRIAESSFTLPVCGVLAALLWWFPYREFTFDCLWGMLLFALTTYVIVETNNGNQLIRIRTRMVSCVWLVTMACTGLHQVSDSQVGALCLAVCYYLLFRTYQCHEPVVDVLHCFFMLGVGCVFVPHMLWFIPFFLWHLLVFMRAFSLRVLCAGMLGCLVPFWFWGGYCTYMADYAPMQEWWHQLSTFVPIHADAYRQLTLQQLVAWALPTFFTLVGTLHYLHNYYNDKIRVRMFLYVYVLQFFVTELIICLQPHLLYTLLPLLLVTCSPLMAHYFALTTTWFCYALFWLAILALAAQAVMMIYLPTVAV